MKLWDQPAPIVVLNSADQNGNPSKGGTFKIPIQLQFNGPNLPPAKNKPPVEQVMVCAAGNVTELVKFGDASKGFVKDQRQIDGIIAVTRNSEAKNERDEEYPRTHEEVTECEHAIEAIAKKAMKSFIDKELIGKNFNETELLNGDEVASIYRSATESS
jgi:hypothetical protein